MAGSTLKIAARDRDVRIGPISLFTLIIVICLAVLAVLTFSTANATLVMSQRQATATSELYLDETAAQTLMAGVSDQLSAVQASGGNGTDGARAVEAALVDLRDQAQDATDGQVSVTASMDGKQLHADFACEGGRVLSIVVTIRDDCSYRIDRWKMTAVQNVEEPMGNLWTGE